MLRKNTVLVLGAGASQPFGFPTGAELADKVVGGLQQGGFGYTKLVEVGRFPRDLVDDFRETFHRSGKNSLDAFLEHRPDLRRIGKAATAVALIPCEQPANLFRFQNNWLRYLYNRLNTTFAEFAKNRLSIITFNYDRTVEFFMFTSLKNTYSKSDREVGLALSSVPIIHLHGRLGYLPWENSDSRPFESAIDEPSLESSIRNIKIIHEEIRGRDADFRRAKELLSAADQILFIGFGYDPTNMERLGVSCLPPGRAWGTMVGLSKRERATVKALCEGRIRLIAGDCMEFVRERIDWG